MKDIKLEYIIIILNDNSIFTFVLWYKLQCFYIVYVIYKLLL